MVHALDNLTKGAFADYFNHLESIAYLVTIDDSIVPLGVIEAIVD